MKHTQKMRNSSIELLRVISMLMVVAHHFVVHNLDNAWDINGDSSRFLIAVFAAPLGKISIVSFFAVTAWFLCEKESGFRVSFQRVWKMELQVLFYAWGMCILFVIFDKKLLNTSTILKSLFPVSTDLWWYVTSYILFLLLFPFLNKGLYLLGKQYHLCLCLVTIVVWGGIQGVLPNGYMDLANSVAFVWIYILISYYKWYMKSFSFGASMWIAGAGFTLCLLPRFVFGYLPTVVSLSYPLNRVRCTATDVFSREWKLPVMMAGLGLVLVFTAFSFNNRVINWLAKSAFSVYLITEYPLMRTLLWKKYFTFSSLENGALPVAISFVVLVFLIYLLCALVDTLRRLVFRFMIDKPANWLFKKVWDDCFLKMKIFEKDGGSIPDEG